MDHNTTTFYFCLISLTFQSYPGLNIDCFGFPKNKPFGENEAGFLQAECPSITQPTSTHCNDVIQLNQLDTFIRRKIQ